MRVLTCYGYKFLLENSDGFDSSFAAEGFHIATEPLELPDEPISSLRFESRNGYFDLYFDESLVASNQTPELVSQLAINRIHQTVAERKPELSFLKGDSVLHGSELVLLLGGEFSGQTRLSRHLLMDYDFHIFSENFVVLNEDGEALKYPAPEIPRQPVEPTSLLLLNYVPDAKLNVSPQNPGLTCLNLFNLLRGDDESIARAGPRLATLCESVDLRLVGVRGDLGRAGELVWSMYQDRIKRSPRKNLIELD